jgi:hypothetical protein
MSIKIFAESPARKEQKRVVLKISKKRTLGPGGVTVWNAKCARTNRLIGTFVYQDQKLKVRLEKGIGREMAQKMFEKEFPTLHKVYI